MTTRARRQQPDIEPRARPSAARTRYKPSVRSRASRDELRTPLRPNYSQNLSENTTVYFLQTVTTTARFDLVASIAGFRFRVLRISCLNVVSQASNLVEVYFSNGVAITSAGVTPIDLMRVPDGGRDDTRTHSRGTGPIGETSEPISARFVTAPAGSGNYVFIVEYTSEKGMN